MATHIAYCPRCDRAFTSLKSMKKAKAMVEAHVRKHPDYVPELHSEIDPV